MSAINTAFISSVPGSHKVEQYYILLQFSH